MFLSANVERNSSILLDVFVVDELVTTVIFVVERAKMFVFVFIICN